MWDALTLQALQDQVHLPASVKTLMDTWLLQKGYPIINVTRNYLIGTVTFTQVRSITCEN